MEVQALVLLVCMWSVHGYPSRPLNDRPGELAWQAWLLVDSQNQATEGDRRITPKSVFIAPRLGTKNDSLPDCADGYQADQMGRCIKFVKVDQAAHLNFLLQRLNAVYATKSDEEDTSEHDEDESSAPTSGPLQLNIPLGTGFSSGEEIDPESNPEIAIIVAPTNGNFDVEDDDGKVNVKRTNVHIHNETANAHKSEESQSFLGDRGDPVNEDEETAAYDGEQEEADDQRGVPDDYDEESSTKSEAGSTRIKQTTTTDANEPVETEQPSTTTEHAGDSLQALFFLVPINNATHVQNNRTANATDTPIARPATNSTPLMSDTEPSALPVKAKPDTETQPVDDLATLIEPVRATDHHLPADLAIRRHQVRFPSEHTRPSASLETHSLTNDEIEQLFQEFIEEARNPAESGAPHRKRPPSNFPLEHPQIQRPIFDMAFNHRNRDRNSDFWKIPPEPREQSSQKPLVLRFDRHPSSNYASRYNTEVYYPQDSSRYYEQTTRENLPILFPSRSRRNHFR